VKRILQCVWQWLCAIFRKSVEAATEPGTPPVDEKLRGKLIWDARKGAYRRRAPKVGRNMSCPCGEMRVSPRDVTKPVKYKWCCND